jgi:hypothetical protein
MCVRSRKAGHLRRKSLRIPCSQIFDVLLDKLREDRYGKLEKLLTKFRDVKVNDNILSLGKLSWDIYHFTTIMRRWLL